MKESHDKLFIEAIWKYAGWIDRIGMIGILLLLLAISIQGWLK